MKKAVVCDSCGMYRTESGITRRQQDPFEWKIKSIVRVTYSKQAWNFAEETKLLRRRKGRKVVSLMPRVTRIQKSNKSGYVYRTEIVLKHRS